MKMNEKQMMEFMAFMDKYNAMKGDDSVKQLDITSEASTPESLSDKGNVSFRTFTFRPYNEDANTIMELYNYCNKMVNRHISFTEVLRCLFGHFTENKEVAYKRLNTYFELHNK